MIKIGKIRTRTYAYEQLAFALIHERRASEAVRVCQYISRSTFEEHCQRYVRELFYFPPDASASDEEPTSHSRSSPTTTSNDPYEARHVFDADNVSLIHFLDYIEQYPGNARNLSLDTLFFSLFKAYEKGNRLDEFTKVMRDRSSPYVRHFSSKTKDALSQAGITLPIKSLSSPKPAKKRLAKHDRFFQDHDYDDEQSNSF